MLKTLFPVPRNSVCYKIGWLFQHFQTHTLKCYILLQNSLEILAFPALPDLAKRNITWFSNRRTCCRWDCSLASRSLSACSWAALSLSISVVRSGFISDESCERNLVISASLSINWASKRRTCIRSSLFSCSMVSELDSFSGLS